MSNLRRVVLLVAGSIGVLVGASIMFVPVAFHATTGITLGTNPSLLNETRASGGALLASGLFIVAGAFRPGLAFASTAVATLLYCAYGLSRIFSMAADGMPDVSLVWVTGIELAIGAACAVTLAPLVRGGASANGRDPSATPMLGTVTAPLRRDSSTSRL